MCFDANQLEHDIMINHTMINHTMINHTPVLEHDDDTLMFSCFNLCIKC